MTPAPTRSITEIIQQTQASVQASNSRAHSANPELPRAQNSNRHNSPSPSDDELEQDSLQALQGSRKRHGQDVSKHLPNVAKRLRLAPKLTKALEKFTKVFLIYVWLLTSLTLLIHAALTRRT